MQSPQQNIKNEHFKLQKMQTPNISIIQSTIKTQKTYYDRIRGKSSQTKQLNIHMKTLNQKYLKKCSLANQLNDNDKQIYFQYKTMRANFQSSKYLYETISQQTKQMYRDYSKSSQIIKDILKSDRMFLNNKIIFIKFMKKVQSGIDKPNVSWKQQYFKNKNRKKTQNQMNKNQQKKNQQSKKMELPENQQKKSDIKALDNVISVRTIFAGGMGHGFNILELNKQVKEKPTFGQAHFGGEFLFSINNRIDM